MPNLHVHYYNGNLKLFRQELDGSGHSHAGHGGHGGGGGGGGGGAGSGSMGRSWTLSSVHGGSKGDPNERDAFGRTVLHLAASNLSPTAYTYLSILLRNPNISVNLQDYESGYTALHRALFAGNIRAARDLLARNDVDVSVKDAEGLTAFDLFNGTVDGTNPPGDVDGTDLYVWGVNRNFVLGTGDVSDKTFPDRINLQTQRQASDRPDPVERFFHVGVKDVVMSKLHTAAVTSESRGNLSICGFGANGRLGRTIHSQYALLPMPELPHTITSTALAQDHTLALTSGGYILSWGLNRFSQLGYTIDPADRPNARDADDMIQISPRRIVGPLKKEWVKGVAAGRMASACWTDDALWTWGTNAGHLGYEKAANPVQVLPRKVTVISQPIVDVAMSDYAMICLLDSFEVLCFHHDAHFKISFSTPRILSEAFPFRPPQSTLRPMIKKVTSCGVAFAALSSIGDVFTFTLPNPLEDISKDARDRHVSVKPQLIWALRKHFTAVKDVALGSDGTVIICTHSGHVFVRQRVKSGGQHQFKRIPYLQRVIKVAANESGAFAAIRVDALAKPIPLTGRSLEEDLFLLQPHFRRFEHQMTAEDFERLNNPVVQSDEDVEDESSNSVSKDLEIATKLCTILTRWTASSLESLFSWSEALVGSDISLLVGEYSIPAHGVVLSLRIPVFAKILSGVTVDRIELVSEAEIRFDVCHPLVIFLLLQYIYSDEVAAIWDPRVAREIQETYKDLKLPINDIKRDLRYLADSLDLAPLSTVLSAAAKTPMPRRTLPQDLQTFFNQTYSLTSPPSCDVTLILADKQVSCQSVILRARCPFFEAMFADSDWTLARQTDGRVIIRMEHLRWRPMKLVYKFIHEGREDDLFDYLHQETLDEFLDFVFDVLAAATELLLDRLVLICSRVIIRHCNAYNAAALASEAAFYQATTLKLSVFDYIVASMETMLESGLLDDMDPDVLLELCSTITEKQGRKLPVPRKQVLVNEAMEKHREWLSLQDIPVPRVRQHRKWKPRSPVISPVDLMTPTPVKERRPTPSPLCSPDLPPVANSTIDDIFSMDDEMTTPKTDASDSRMKASRPITPFDLASNTKGPVWKSRAVEAERVDMRTIMAEAETSKSGSSVPVTPVNKLSQKDKRRLATPLASSPSKAATAGPILGSSPSSGSAWRSLEKPKTSLSSVQAQQDFNKVPVVGFVSRAPGSMASPVPQRAGSSKIITPVKLQTPPTGPRRSASESAWAQASFAPPPYTAPTPASPNTQSFSLLAIQQQERDLADKVKQPVASLAEIQEEERKAEEARVAEVEFMRWWQEEEARVAKENGTGGSRGGGGRGGRGGTRGGTRKANTRGKAATSQKGGPPGLPVVKSTEGNSGTGIKVQLSPNVPSFTPRQTIPPTRGGRDKI